MTPRARLFVVLLTAPVILFVVVGGLLGHAVPRTETYRHLRVFEDVMSLVIGNYVEQVDPQRLMTGALRGLVDGLDADSAYLTAAEVQQNGRALPDGDVGLVLMRQYYLRVVAARDDSPAYRAGLRPGDYLRAIDGKPTRDLSALEGARLLRGAPGTKVTLAVIRGNAADPHLVELVRERSTRPDVTARLAASGIGYLRIAAFGPRLAEVLAVEMNRLAREGASRYVIDVRSTAEGALATGIKAARLFIPSGTLAIHEVRGGPREPIMAATGDGRIAAPLVVLINAGTSGAAELFAAAIAGNRRGILMGEGTLGRTAEQSLVRLPDGTGLWMSTAWYLTPEGAVLHERGLKPDVAIQEPDVEFGAPPPTADPVLQQALERLRG